MSQPPTPSESPGQPLSQPQPQPWPQQGMQPPADRVVDPDGPATDAASTPTDGSAVHSIDGWTPPPWTAGPDAPAGWTPPPWSPDAADTRPFWRRSLEPILVVIGCAVLIGIGIFFAATDDDYSSPEVAPAEPTQVSTEVATPDEIDEDLNWDEYNIDDSVDLRVGDCFNLKDPDAEIEHVRKVPCKTGHDYELFYVGAMGKRSHPTEDAILDYVIDYCDPAFGHYIGKDVDDSKLDYDWLLPTEDAWRSGARTVQCAAYDPNNSLQKGSLRGAHR